MVGINNDVDGGLVVGLVAACERPGRNGTTLSIHEV